MNRLNSPPTIKPLLEKMATLEKGFPTVMTLLEAGLIQGGNTIQAGDWDLRVWPNGVRDRSFSFVAMENARCESKPFPRHAHEQRLWILCSKGVVQITFDCQSIYLHPGDYVLVEPGTEHEILPATEEPTTALLVTIPSDSGITAGGGVG
jgi:quercetin dioxygenase-like cupin family protein